MQTPRRPSADRRRVSGARDRPVSWSRRLEEAREERARVLAARERGASEPGATHAAASGDPPDTGEAAVPSDEEGSAGRTGAGRTRISRRMAVGFLAGAAAGAAMVWLLLPAGPTDPLGVEVGDADAPVVASAPPPTPSAATVSAAGGAAVEVGADDAAEAAEAADLPEITAADRARAAQRGVVAPDRDGPAADPLPDAADAQVPAMAPGPDEPADADPALGRDFPADALPPRVDDIAPAPQGDGAAQPSAVATAGDEQERLSAAVDGEAEGEAVSVRETVEVAAAPQPAPDGAEGDAADAAAAATGEPDAEPVAEAAAPPPDPPQPPDVAEATVPDAAGGDAPEEVPTGGAGLLHVHAAPRVTSEELAEVVAVLSGAGFAVAETRRVDFRISQTNVRYFHEEDAEVAAGVAQTVSGVARDFTDYEPSPDPGTIEVWLEG